jgi:hypothetical protein
LLSIVDRALRAARTLLPTFGSIPPASSLSREERLALILSAIDRCGADCPACAIWALEQHVSRPAWDMGPTGRILPC